MSLALLQPEGLLRLERFVWRAAIGRAGVSGAKREGDGATPAGVLALLRVLYRADRVARPATMLPCAPLAPEDGWCDDPAHAEYNHAVRRPHPARGEALWREDGLYDVIGVLDWNTAPVRRGAGSAIFLHVARPDYAPTAGCIALALPDLQAALAAGLTAIEVPG